MRYMVMRERWVRKYSTNEAVIQRSYIGRDQKLVDERHAKKYATVERAETALADFVLRHPKFFGELRIVLA
jgi:hypothetical protein